MAEYKIFVIDAEDEKTTYKTSKIEWTRYGWLKLIDAVFYLDAVGDWSDDKVTVTYPPHRILLIEEI